MCLNMCLFIWRNAQKGNPATDDFIVKFDISDFQLKFKFKYY